MATQTDYRPGGPFRSEGSHSGESDSSNHFSDGAAAGLGTTRASEIHTCHDLRRGAEAVNAVYIGTRTARGGRVAGQQDRLVSLCQKFEHHSPEPLHEMCTAMKLNIAEDPQEAFLSVVRGLFTHGKTLTRVLCFLTLGGVLARYCSLRRELYQFADEVVKWQTIYINSELGEWLTEQGGLVSKCSPRSAQSGLIYVSTCTVWVCQTVHRPITSFGEM